MLYDGSVERCEVDETDPCDEGDDGKSGIAVLGEGLYS